MAARGNKRSATASDREIGKRIRTRRIALNLSQTALGDELGVTFQQVQKYEGGTNRIPATRLMAVAKALDVPASFFFNENAITKQASQLSDPALALRLQKAFSKLDSKKKKEVVLIVERVADRSKS